MMQMHFVDFCSCWNVTGHSLGGALAILFTSVLVLHEEMKAMQRLLGVYTFGQPRVGDRQLARYMDTSLRLEDEPGNSYFGMKYLVPEYLNPVWELIRSLAMGYIHGPEYREGWLFIFVRVTGLLFPGTSAHSLTDYINSVKLGKGNFVRMSKTHEVESFECRQPWII
ncbi:hypothetical protein C1H46_005718 [Malus baccata]|uniref:Fungal lipase-type domain-containing protein n=1 Tax=Malus baccata TaxID=106549 RepID=A0A540NCH1_MALBA|nr:hypothetical protein C1H46_005718 [Malus baccata]